MEKFINNAPFALVIVILVIGFVLLIKGADFFVEGSSSVAKRLHVPSIIIGLTIVAMGTSLPETAVSVSASIAGNNELAVSNVVGSSRDTGSNTATGLISPVLEGLHSTYCRWVTACSSAHLNAILSLGNFAVLPRLFPYARSS